MVNVISRKNWGMYGDQAVFLYRMENSLGAYVELTNFGASIVAVVVPDRNGHFGNVVLGFPHVQGYLDDHCYIGATVGRYANRIAFAGFELDDHHFRLESNDGPHTNHGGVTGFDKCVFDVTTHDEAISFHLKSLDGDGGFPGNLQLAVTYRWSETNELHIQYEATSDKKTVLNVTNHAYFNLSGSEENIIGHQLQVHASNVLETTQDYIPTGALVPCPPPSFSQLRALNHCYVLGTTMQSTLKKAARLQHSASGRILEVHTTYPALIVYTGDFLSSDLPGHTGRSYRPFDGICLECQYFPDSPNHPDFPSTVLDVGCIYNEQILLKFSVSPE